MLTLQNIFFVLLLLVLSILRCESTEDIHGVLYGSTIKQIKENDGTSENLPTIIEGKIPIDCSKARSNDNAYVTVRVKSSHEDISKLCQNYWQSHYGNPAQGYIPPAGPGQFQPYFPMQDPQAPHQFIEPRRPFISPFDTPPHFGSAVTGHQSPLNPLQGHVLSHGPYGDEQPMGSQGVLYGAATQVQQPILQESMATQRADSGTNTETNEQLIAERDETIQQLEAQLEQFRQQMQHGSPVSAFQDKAPQPIQYESTGTRQTGPNIAATLNRPLQHQVGIASAESIIPVRHEVPGQPNIAASFDETSQPQGYVLSDGPYEDRSSMENEPPRTVGPPLDGSQLSMEDAASRIEELNDELEQCRQAMHVMENDNESLNEQLREIKDSNALKAVKESEDMERGALEQDQERDFHQLQHSMQHEPAGAAQATALAEIQQLRADLDHCLQTEHLLTDQVDHNKASNPNEQIDTLAAEKMHRGALEIQYGQFAAEAEIDRLKLDLDNCHQQKEQLNEKLHQMERDGVDMATGTDVPHIDAAVAAQMDAQREDIVRIRQENDELRDIIRRERGQRGDGQELPLRSPERMDARTASADETQRGAEHQVAALSHENQQLRIALAHCERREQLALGTVRGLDPDHLENQESGDVAGAAESAAELEDGRPLSTESIIDKTGAEPNLDSGADVLPARALEDAEAPQRIRDALQRIKGTLTEIVEEINQIEQEDSELESQMDHDGAQEGLDALRELKTIRDKLSEALEEQ